MNVAALHGDEVGTHGDAGGLAALLAQHVPQAVCNLQRAHGSLHGEAQQLAANVRVDEALLAVGQVLIPLCMARKDELACCWQSAAAGCCCTVKEAPLVVGQAHVPLCMITEGITGIKWFLAQRVAGEGARC